MCPFCGFAPKKCSNPECQPRWLPQEARFCPECGKALSGHTMITGEATQQNASNNNELYRAISYYKNDETEKAMPIFQKFARMGNLKAQYYLGKLFDDDLEYERAVGWYRIAAEQGHADAQYKLGDCYYYGDGVENDKEKAVQWYRKAAEQGHAEAQYKLGDCYYYGGWSR